MSTFINHCRKCVRRGPHTHGGFTLLELILSIAILSFVLVTIYTTLSMGSRTWEKGEQDIEKVQRMRVIMDLLSREIKAAYPYKVTPGELDTHREFYAFDGKNDYLSLVSCVPLQGGTGKLSWLTFWVEEGEGLVVVERDALRSDIFEEREAVDKNEMVVLDANVTDIRFEYYRAEEGDIEEAAEEGAWEEKWDAEEERTLPHAVYVAVTFMEEATRVGAEDVLYTRELVIPLMIAAADMRGGRRLSDAQGLMKEPTGMAGETALGSTSASGRSGAGSRTGSSRGRGTGGGSRGGTGRGGQFQ